MARKIACRPSKLILSGPPGLAIFGNSDTVIGSFNEIRKPGPLKDCEGPQMTLRAQMALEIFLLILTPGNLQPL